MSTIATPRADRPEHRPDDAVGARGGDARRRILAIVPGLCLAAAGLAAQTGTIPLRICWPPAMRSAAPSSRPRRFLPAPLRRSSGDRISSGWSDAEAHDEPGVAAPRRARQRQA